MQLQIFIYAIPILYYTLEKSLNNMFNEMNVKSRFMLFIKKMYDTIEYVEYLILYLR